ncbi:MAG: nucleotidyltransferase domain-containing protein [Elusimicrobiota bacterium]
MLKKMDNLTEKEKQAVQKLVEGLKKLYGENLAQLILYGSKARGDFEDGSDIDILVVLKKMGLSFDEIDKINRISAPICLENDLLISTIPIEEEWVNADYKTIFVHNVLKEGIKL